MAQTTFSVRMDEVLKKLFEISSPKTEITREGAMQAFLALRTQAKENGVADMSLDDINKEIHLTRMETEI